MPDTPLHCAISGDPSLPNLVFLHGFLGTGKDWAEVLPSFEHQFNCISIDLPGHGNSNYFNVIHGTFDKYSTSVYHCLRALGISRCSIIGYSMGGRAALYLSQTFPNLFERVIIESGSPGLESETARVERGYQDEAWARKMKEADPGAFLAEWYRQPVFSTLHGTKLLENIIASRRNLNLPVLSEVIKCMSPGRQKTLWHLLPENKIPHLVIMGDMDEKFCGIGKRMTREGEHFELAMAPECGHIVHAEYPEWFIQECTKFLNQSSSSSSSTC